MNRPTLFLRICYIATLLSAVLFILLVESELLQMPTINDESSHYIVNIVAVALTLALLPLALHIFSFSLPRRQSRQSVTSYVRWSVIRIALLSVPLYFNTLAYYVFDKYASCGWMAMMSAVLFLLVWPSDGRMRHERETAYTQDEK